jgi:hypothetical protein
VTSLSWRHRPNQNPKAGSVYRPSGWPAPLPCGPTLGQRPCRHLHLRAAVDAGALPNSPFSFLHFSLSILKSAFGNLNLKDSVFEILNLKRTFRFKKSLRLKTRRTQPPFDRADLLLRCTDIQCAAIRNSEVFNCRKPRAKWSRVGRGEASRRQSKWKLTLELLDVAKEGVLPAELTKGCIRRGENFDSRF